MVLSPSVWTKPRPVAASMRDKPGDPPIRTVEQRAWLDGLPAGERPRYEGCSPGRLAEIIDASRLGTLGGERVGREPAPTPAPEPDPMPELDWSFV